MSTNNLKLVESLGLEISRFPDAKGEMVCRCPLHDDKSPSLSINVITGKYHCWSGCMAGSSISSLVYRITGEQVGEDSHSWVEILREKLMPKKEPYIHIPSIPLLPLAINNPGQEYLTGSKRKLTTESIKKWNVLWWQEQNAVVIPVDDVGFVLRYLSGPKKYKYVNGSQISKTLFGKFQVSEKINKSIIIVEGAFDTIYLHQCGFSNSVAVLGSNLSETQTMLLRGYGMPITIMLDGDPEGRKSCEKMYHKLKGEFDVKVAELLDGKDPVDCDSYEIKMTLENARRRM